MNMVRQRFLEDARAVPVRPTVLFAVAVGDRVGMGHLARCSTIADALGDRATTILLMPDAVRESLNPWVSRFDHVLLSDSERGLDRTRDLVVVTDGVASSPSTHGWARRAGRVVTIDDGPPRRLSADLVVNPNLGATPADYSFAGGTSVLAGPAFALIDPRFADARPTLAPVPVRARRLLLTCGASDPMGVTDRYLDAISLADPTDYEVKVVIGPLVAETVAMTARCQVLGATLVRAPACLAGLASWAEVALTTLGTTAAELACLGVPNLAAAVVDAQRSHLAAYAALGIVEPLGWHDNLEPATVVTALNALAGSRTRRSRMRARGMNLVDGNGARRVADSILDGLDPAS